MTVIELPFPISVNAMFADGKTRRHKSQRYAGWITEASWRLKAQRPAPVWGPVKVIYGIGKPDRRKRDLSNLVKGTEDLLVSHGIIEDDSMVQDLRAYWDDTVVGVRVTIVPHCVSETGDAEAA